MVYVTAVYGEGGGAASGSSDMYAWRVCFAHPAIKDDMRVRAIQHAGGRNRFPFPRYMAEIPDAPEEQVGIGVVGE